MSPDLNQKFETAVQSGVILATKIDIVQSLPDIDFSEVPNKAARQSSKPFQLTEREFEFLELKSGIEEEEIPDSWGYRPYELEERVTDKGERLPKRIELLLEDVRMLDEYEFFERGEWDEMLLDLVDVGTLHSESFGYGDPGDDEYRIAATGEILGQMLDRLIPAEFVDSASKANITWGFIQGFWFSNDIDAPASYRDRNLDTVLNQVSEQASSQLKEAEKAETDANEWYMELNREREETHRYIQDILETYGIVSENRISNLFASSIARELAPDNQPYSGDFSFKECFDAKSVLNEVIDQRLLEQRQLGKIVREDKSRLVKKSGRSADPVDVLVEVATTGADSSRNIARNIQTDMQKPRRDWTAGVTEVARDLAGQRTPQERIEREIWNEHPLLQGSSERWNTTDYGYILGTYLSNQDQHMIFLDDYSDSLISRVVAEFDLPHEVYYVFTRDS